MIFFWESVKENGNFYQPLIYRVFAKMVLILFDTWTDDWTSGLISESIFLPLLDSCQFTNQIWFFTLLFRFDLRLSDISDLTISFSDTFLRQSSCIRPSFHVGSVSVYCLTGSEYVRMWLAGCRLSKKCMLCYLSLTFLYLYPLLSKQHKQHSIMSLGLTNTEKLILP